ncbi:hypothetical protein Micbo1qcDRAFT_424 [Microdochium bolleyi]|uniref:Uncharacterized protein n=1 Tax=Microdochium bolleyi TaxID=196109 RepID=A0A136JGU5_9PEZI|nr:hypothetical protein Micbo1qcDRAFT_424 [Microdochium bolleyi]
MGPGLHGSGPQHDQVHEMRPPSKTAHNGISRPTTAYPLQEGPAVCCEARPDAQGVVPRLLESCLAVGPDGPSRTQAHGAERMSHFGMLCRACLPSARPALPDRRSSPPPCPSHIRDKNHFAKNGACAVLSQPLSPTMGAHSYARYVPAERPLREARAGETTKQSSIAR